ERFQINEVMIDNDTFLDAFHRVKKLADELVEEGSYHPTYFEMLFLMGMVIFAESGVDYVTLETGLGGRLDATTAIENPVACVITSISFDHMQYLGNTIAEIAGEKAGIIVPGVPVIYDANDPEAAAVIAAKAAELGSPAYGVTRADADVLSITKDGITFTSKNEYYKGETFSIPFIARYQVMNASLVLKTVEVMQKDLPTTMEQIKKGLLETRWQGRMETIQLGVIVDGAHNEDGIAKFVETAVHFQEEYPLTLLFSAVNDKDYKDMIHLICSQIRFRSVVVTEVGDYRMVPAEELKEIFEAEGCCVQAEKSVPLAFEKAVAARGEDGLLFCVGSLYLVGEIKAAILEKQKGEQA
ncbi:MAG: bifunctional folylpolyglutamate synthase/dihydrofolate synthase, partial [Clostridiales bacterium]|nr:bifunctional folylpolyglutamate synthase/dihydrofolate synthase [Candidatus Blautia equi]